MRIPSSLNDDNLYRQRGRRAVAPRPYRRLLRLMLGMALVIAVIRQAGNPRIYEAFFSVPPATLDTPRAASARIRVMTVPAQRVGDGSTGNPLTTEVEEPLDGTIAVLDEPTAKGLIASLAEARAAARQPSDASWLPAQWIDALNAAAQASGEQASGELAAASEEATLSSDQPGGSATAMIDWSDPSVMLRLQAALDRWAIQRVDPGSVWKGTDALAFYRLLQEPAPPWLQRQNASRASVVSLLQQPDVYLHRRVAMPGSVARVIRRQAAENPFGVSDYWELWLRPRDGSEHPLVFFTAEVPRQIAQIDSDASLIDGPPVWVEGVYLTRLAYRSASGRQLAPALVGSLHPVLPSAVADVVPPIASPLSGWLLLVMAALLGCSITLLIYVQTRRAASRLRALRRSANPGAERLLGSLSERQTHPPGAGE